jgi:nuclear cap-binding protein subunit 1
MVVPPVPVLFITLLTIIETPFAAEGKEIHALLKRKAAESEIEPVIKRIHALATTMGLPNPILYSTDVYVTSICFIGSKSLSHVLSCIERCKDRLLAVGVQSAPARRQIIQSVMAYWRDQPGVGVNIVDKLLNYTILTPGCVLQWALMEHPARGDALSQSVIFEMVASTVQKVTNRVRQIVSGRKEPGLSDEEKAALDETLHRERDGMKDLARSMEEYLLMWTSGPKVQAIEKGLGGREAAGLVIQWAQRWLRVFRRRFAVEETWLNEIDAQIREEGSGITDMDGVSEV